MLTIPSGQAVARYPVAANRIGLLEAVERDVAILYHVHRSDAVGTGVNDADRAFFGPRASLPPVLLDGKRFGGRASRSRN